MDWKLIKIMLRDYEDGRNKYRDTWRLRNVVVKFGKETEFEEIKVILRRFYKELCRTIDEEKRIEIPGIMSEARFLEIVFEMQKLIQEYYWLRRFEKPCD